MENQNGGLAYAKQNISKMEMEVNNTKGMHMEPWQNVPETPKSTKGKLIRFLKRNLLLILLLLALIFGVVLGVLLRIYVQPPMDKRAKMYFKFPGDLLMRMLKCLILPLIISSLVAGLAGLDAKASGKMGLRAVVFYMATTFIAVVIGIVLVVSIRPGDRSGQIHESAEATERTSNTADSFLDLIRNMFPNNLVTACFRQTKTLQIPVPLPAGIDNSTMTTTFAANVTQRTPNTAYDFSVTEDDGMNVLGLVVYSVAMGIVISRMGPLGKPLFDFFTAMAEATMKLVIVVIWYSPVGILFLVAAEILDMEDPVRDLEALGLYIGTVMAGLAVHGLIVLPLLYFIFLRKNPFVYLYGVLQALITALGTSSSSATLPVTYRCLEENNKVDKRVTRFVLPVGATINMDGTALYEAVAAIFIAQLRGRSLGVGEIIATSITATAASIGAASVPQAGIITMMIVLTALGLPASDVNKIIAVDWLLDRFRTMINVEGDSIGAGIIYHLSRRELAATDDEDPEEVVVFSNEGATNHIPPRGQIMDNAQL